MDDKSKKRILIDAYATLKYNADPWEPCAVKRFRD